MSDDNPTPPADGAMPAIKFKKNFNNKLDCDVFTTYRNVDKEDWYRNRLHHTFRIILDGELYCEAELIDVRRKRHIRKGLAMVDTGAYSEAEAYSILKQYGIDPDSDEYFLRLMFKRED